MVFNDETFAEDEVSVRKIHERLQKNLTCHSLFEQAGVELVPKKEHLI